MAGYGDDSGFSDWLADSGHDLAEGAPSPAILRQRGSVYVDGVYGARFTGAPAGGYAQERAWPRMGATAYGSTIPSDVVPAAVVQASYAAAFYEAEKPGGLSAAASGAAQVKRRRIEGAVEVEYFEGDGTALENATVVLSSVEGLLSPFLIGDAPKVMLGIRSVGC